MSTNKPTPNQPQMGPMAPNADAATLAAEAAAEWRRLRVAELQESHWAIYHCPASGAPFAHPLEVHRRNYPMAPVPGQEWRMAPAYPDTVRCPMHNCLATRERPVETVVREQRAASTPLARAQQLVEALSEWAQQHLDARTWTQRSERARQQREASEAYARGVHQPFDLG